MIKWDYKKKTERGLSHICQLLGEVVLVIQKFIVISEKDGSGMELKHTYYTLHIPYSVY